MSAIKSSKSVVRPKLGSLHQAAIFNSYTQYLKATQATLQEEVAPQAPSQWQVSLGASIRLLYTMAQKTPQRERVARSAVWEVYSYLVKASPAAAEQFKDLITKSLPYEGYDDCWDALRSPQFIRKSIKSEFTLQAFRLICNFISSITASGTPDVVLDPKFCLNLCLIVTTFTDPAFIPSFINMTLSKATFPSEDHREFLQARFETCVMGILRDVATIHDPTAPVKEVRARATVLAAIRERAEFEFDMGEDLSEIDEGGLRSLCEDALFKTGVAS